MRPRRVLGRYRADDALDRPQRRPPSETGIPPNVSPGSDAVLDLTKMYENLGLNSRAQLAALVARTGLASSAEPAEARAEPFV